MFVYRLFINSPLLSLKSKVCRRGSQRNVGSQASTLLVMSDFVTVFPQGSLDVIGDVWGARELARARRFPCPQRRGTGGTRRGFVRSHPFAKERRMDGAHLFVV